MIEDPEIFTVDGLHKELLEGGQFHFASVLRMESKVCRE